MPRAKHASLSAETLAAVLDCPAGKERRAVVCGLGSFTARNNELICNAAPGGNRVTMRIALGVAVKLAPPPYTGDELALIKTVLKLLDKRVQIDVGNALGTSVYVTIFGERWPVTRRLGFCLKLGSRLAFPGYVGMPHGSLRARANVATAPNTHVRDPEGELY